MKVTRSEKFQIQFLLPVQGSIETLEQVQQILDKIKIVPEDAQSIEDIEIDFDNNEIFFLKEMIKVLSQLQKLTLPSLSLVKKILNN